MTAATEGKNGSTLASADERDVEMEVVEQSTNQADGSSSEQANATAAGENGSVEVAKNDVAVTTNDSTSTQAAAQIAPEATSGEESQSTQATQDKIDVASPKPEEIQSNGAVATPESTNTESLKRKDPSPSTDNAAETTTAPSSDNNKPVPTAVPTETESLVKKKQKVDATSDSSATAPVSSIAATAPLMISRDDMAKMEEDGGMLKFDVISNDGKPEHMVQLTTLKNIFARQLPKMPREYIVRLVFDRNHRSMVILKNGKHVIGGICYRPFEANHFGEIAFCAINAADQVKGYGTRLMNHLKEYVKAAGITHFLTYADNYAIGYFKKQGFSKVVSMPRPNWFGYIKDYDGGTLMECTLHHQINYLRITSMVQQQRKKIQDKIKERSHADLVYPGLTRFAEGRTMDLYMIPGVQEAGWSHAVIRNSRVGTRDPGSLKTQLQQLYKHVFSHRSAWPFHEPVDTNIVVDYLDYIKEPIDLTLIQKRIESGHYLSKAALKTDLDKMCANCMTYNTPDTNYYKAAKDLQEFIDKRIQVPK